MWDDRCVKFVGFLLALLESLCEHFTEGNQVFRRPVAETQPHGMCFSCSKGEMVASCHLCPHIGGINRILFAVDDVIIGAIFDIGTGVWNAIEPFHIGLLLAGEQVRRALAIQPALPIVIMLGLDYGIGWGRGLIFVFAQRGTRQTWMPRPGGAEPECMQPVQRCRFGSSVDDGDVYEDILRGSFGVFNVHVEITIIVEYTCVNQLIFGHAAPAPAILLYQVSIGVLGLGLFIQVFHIAVGRSVVTLVLLLFDVFPAVALWPGQPKEAFFQDRIAPVPERQREADVLQAVAYSRYSAFTPTGGPGARVRMRHVVPGGAIWTVVRAHSSPRALTHLRAPPFPLARTLIHV